MGSLSMVRGIEEIGGVPRVREVQAYTMWNGGRFKLNVPTMGGPEAQDLGLRIARAYEQISDESIVGDETNFTLSPKMDKVFPSLDMAFCAVFLAHEVGEVEGLFCGELTTEGMFLPLRNPLSSGQVAIASNLTLYCHPQSAAIAARLGGQVVPIASVEELFDTIVRRESKPIPDYTPPQDDYTFESVDMKYVRGQENAKRAVELAVAGGHNLLLVGPPGEGKTMMAKTVSTIAPPLSSDEMMEVSAIYQQAGKSHGFITQRPIRFIDPSISKAALVGGGTDAPEPGEITLAHRGVLFADELLQFPRGLIEALRGPMQDGYVSLSRVAWKVQLPAEFQFIAAANPCPCGYAGHPSKPCTCTPTVKKKYQEKLSGPIMDRIPLIVFTPPVSPAERFSGVEGEDSATIRERVMAAQKLQQIRYAGTNVKCNNDLGPSTMEYVLLDNLARDLLIEVADETKMSNRQFDNTVKLSRTLADLAGNEKILDSDILNAVECSVKTNKKWMV